MNIFLTGGTGFLGSYILRYLVRQEGVNIRALRRADSRMELVAEVADQVEWVEGDLLDTVSLEAALEGIDQVYHCAAMVSFQSKDLRRMHRINVEGTANVVNLSLEAGIQKLVHISSIAALGRSKDKQQVNEQSDWEPHPFNSNYAISKHLAEMEAWRGLAEGLNIAILNPSVILGSGFWLLGTARMFQQVWDGLRFYPPGGTGYVDVRDVARLAIKLMESDSTSGQRFIANGTNLTYHELFQNIAAAMDKRPPTIRANAILRGLAWRVDWFRSLFNGGDRVVTREIAESVGRTFFYDNQRSIDYFDFQYTPIQETITTTARQLVDAYRNKLEYGVLPLN